jgi:DNA-binding transcriptional MocR family regulator
VVNELVESGEIQRHVYQKLQPAYAARYRKLLEAIEHHLIPLGVSLRHADDAAVTGGYFIWITLPAGKVTGDALAKRCQQEALIVAPGTLFQVPGNSSATCDYGVRLCFAWEDEERLQEGVERLSNVLRTMLDQEGRGADGMQPAPANDPTGTSQRNFW